MGKRFGFGRRGKSNGSSSGRRRRAWSLGRRIGSEEKAILSGLKRIKHLLSQGPPKKNLPEALAIASQIRRLATSDEGYKSALRSLFKERGIKRTPKKLAIAVAKLCFPGRGSTTYNRYSAVLKLAWRHSWDKEHVLAEIKKHGIDGLKKHYKKAANKQKHYKKGADEQKTVPPWKPAGVDPVPAS